MLTFKPRKLLRRLKQLNWNINNILLMINIICELIVAKYTRGCKNQEEHKERTFYGSFEGIGKFTLYSNLITTLLSGSSIIGIYVNGMKNWFKGENNFEKHFQCVVTRRRVFKENSKMSHDFQEQHHKKYDVSNLWRT